MSNTTMKKFTLIGPDYKFCQQMKVMENFPQETTTIVLTKISPKDDLITDFLLENVTITNEDDNATNITTDSEVKGLGIFMLVHFMHCDECDSLYDIFSKYDGKIFATNTEDLLKLSRETFASHNTESMPDMYVMTGY